MALENLNPYVAVANTGANILNSVISGFGAGDVAEKQNQLIRELTDQRIREGKQAYSDIAPTFQPYMKTGESGLTNLNNLVANVGQYDYTPEQFQYNGQVSDFLDPSNKYASDQAMRALRSAQAVGGTGLNSGGALKELNQQQFGMGQQGWQNALDNMNNDSNTKYGRFLDNANITMKSMQDSFNNRYNTANLQIQQGQYGTSGNANTRMNVANLASSAIGNQIDPMASNQGSITGAPYATGSGIINSVFNKDNMQAVGQYNAQNNNGYEPQGYQQQVPSSFSQTLNYQQPQNAGNFGMNASYGQNGWVPQGNINIGRP